MDKVIKSVMNKKNIITFLIITVIVLGFVLKNEHIDIQLFLKMDIRWITLAFIMVLLYYTIEAYILKSAIEYHKTKFKFGKYLKNIFIGQLFNGITPFASGGQPIQIYHLNKKGISSAEGASALFINFLMYQIALTIYGMFFLIFKFNFFANSSNNFLYIVFIGFIIDISVVLFLIAIFLWKDTVKKVLFNLIRKTPFLKEKNKQSISRKVIRFMKEFSKAITNLKDKKWLFEKLFILNMIKLAVIYTIPFFIAKSVGVNNLNIINIIAGSAFLKMITSFVPIPGASGGAEGGFYFIFSIFFTFKTLFFVIVVWRFITYYFAMIIGMIVFTIFLLKNRNEIIEDTNE
ncbi:MAG: hypothetical protein B6I28_02555 [Fusobacteriia bacterium 4572_132]|nr:MAG: hypothetical protein B6I28_02555 [Fusobacteriia bacterium 4572_132]